MPIVEPATGAINLFFRQIWEQIRLAVSTVNTLGEGYTNAVPLTAALTGEVLQVTVVGALYRFTYYLHKTVADGVASSLQVTARWTDNGVSLSKTFTALTTDTTGAVASESFMFYCDPSVSVTFDIAYSSNTPAKMTYDAYVRLEQMN